MDTEVPHDVIALRHVRKHRKQSGRIVREIKRQKRLLDEQHSLWTDHIVLTKRARCQRQIADAAMTLQCLALLQPVPQATKMKQMHSINQAKANAIDQVNRLPSQLSQRRRRMGSFVKKLRQCVRLKNCSHKRGLEATDTQENKAEGQSDCPLFYLYPWQNMGQYSKAQLEHMLLHPSDIDLLNKHAEDCLKIVIDHSMHPAGLHLARIAPFLHEIAFAAHVVGAHAYAQYELRQANIVFPLAIFDKAIIVDACNASREAIAYLPQHFHDERFPELSALVDDTILASPELLHKVARWTHVPNNPLSAVQIQNEFNDVSDWLRRLMFESSSSKGLMNISNAVKSIITRLLSLVQASLVDQWCHRATEIPEWFLHNRKYMDSLPAPTSYFDKLVAFNAPKPSNVKSDSSTREAWLTMYVEKFTIANARCYLLDEPMLRKYRTEMLAHAETIQYIEYVRMDHKVNREWQESIEIDRRLSEASKRLDILAKQLMLHEWCVSFIQSQIRVRQWQSTAPKPIKDEVEQETKVDKPMVHIVPPTLPHEENHTFEMEDESDVDEQFPIDGIGFHPSAHYTQEEQVHENENAQANQPLQDDGMQGQSHANELDEIDDETTLNDDGHFDSANDRDNNNESPGHNRDADHVRRFTIDLTNDDDQYGAEDVCMSSVAKDEEKCPAINTTSEMAKSSVVDAVEEAKESQDTRNQTWSSPLPPQGSPPSTSAQATLVSEMMASSQEQHDKSLRTADVSDDEPIKPPAKPLNKEAVAVDSDDEPLKPPAKPSRKVSNLQDTDDEPIKARAKSLRKEDDTHHSEDEPIKPRRKPSFTLSASKRPIEPRVRFRPKQHTHIDILCQQAMGRILHAIEINLACTATSCGHAYSCKLCKKCKSHCNCRIKPVEPLPRAVPIRPVQHREMPSRAPEPEAASAEDLRNEQESVFREARARHKRRMKVIPSAHPAVSNYTSCLEGSQLWSCKRIMSIWTTTKDIHAVLGVPKHASWGMVKKQYRTLVLKLHPDKTGTTPEKVSAFVAVTAAYKRLRSSFQTNVP